MRIPATLCFAWLILAVQVGYLHAQDPPYKGKTIRVLVGFPSGGGSDAEGRVLARHIGKYIPGNPTLIVQNMPGAGGLTASNWFEELAKPDGTDPLLLRRQHGGDAAGIRHSKALNTICAAGKYWAASTGRPSVVLLRPDKLERLTAKDKPPLGIGARTRRRRLEHDFSLGRRISELERALDLRLSRRRRAQAGIRARRGRSLCDSKFSYACAS